MLRSILYKILDHNKSSFVHFQAEYRKYQALLREGGSNNLAQWPLESLKKILVSLGNYPRPERLYLIIDAIDESAAKDRWDIVQLLHKLTSMRSCIVKILLTSRPTNELDHHFWKPHNYIRLQSANSTDILMFSNSILGRDLGLPSHILTSVKDYIATHAHGLFIWVHLIKEELLQYIERGYTANMIYRLLQSLPTELERFYEEILRRLENGDKQDVEDGLRMIRIVLSTHRHLRVAEIHHALAIPDDPDVEFSPTDESFQNNLVLGIENHIIHCGGNFLNITGHSGIFCPYKY